MMRTVTLEIGGKSYPMLLTLGAYIQICERHGDLPSCLKRLDDLVAAADNPALIQEYTWLAEQMLYAAHDGTGEAPLTQEDLLGTLSPGDIPYVQTKVLECIRLGQSREVGVGAPKNDGGGAQAASQAPES